MRLNTRRIAFAGVLAAAYAAITLASASLAYGPVQFRLAEALTVFCCFTPAAVPGMVLGCMAANLASFVSAWDFVIGSCATLLACLLTRAMSRRLEEQRWLIWLIPLPTVLCNAVIVGAEIAVFFDDRAFLPAWGLNALSVGAGEAAVMYALGLPFLYFLLKNRELSRKLRGL
jgi:uncharacterized membrane protein